MKKIMFTGGGTVGHVTLNLLLVPKFIEDGWEVHYIGDKKGIEYQEIKKSGLDVRFHSIATGKLRRYFSFQNMMDVFKVAWGTLQSIAILLRVRPQVLFSKGGFVSVPPVIAARLTRVPVYIHESDLSMGLANKIAYKFATKMYTTFEQAHGLTKSAHIGAVTKVTDHIPTTSEVLEEKTQGFQKDLPTLLFVGGSAGARVFNEFVTEHQAELLQHYNIINLTGDSTLNQAEGGLYRVDYVTDQYLPMLQKADLVVTRGGANTLFELLAMNKLHLIVPLGKEASRGDQIENAQYFVDKGYAEQLQEDQLTLETFNETIQEMLKQSQVYHQAMEKSTELLSLDDFYGLLQKDISKGKDDGRQ